jgi:hypothetical protein
MKLKPRHYALIALLLVLGAYNIFRLRSKRLAHPGTTLRVETTPPKHGTSPLWNSYDKAAGDALSGAPDPQFQADLQGLTQSLTTAVPDAQTTSAELADLSGCRTWLLFYRSERVHPTNKPDWLPETRGHVMSCTQNHWDMSS